MYFFLPRTLFGGLTAAIMGVGAQSTLGGGTKFLPEKCVLKIMKMPKF